MLQYGSIYSRQGERATNRIIWTKSGFVGLGRRQIHDGGYEPDATTWIAALILKISIDMVNCTPMTMRGDDMGPMIHDGDTMFVDYKTQQITETLNKLRHS